MPDTITSTDHDVLNTLVETVKNMKEGQDKFHIEMKESFADLKYNLADRLTKVETGLSNADKVFMAKVEQDRRDAMLNTRITKLEFWQQKVVGGLIILNVLLGIALAWFNH
jgi:hypothetical protein